MATELPEINTRELFFCPTHGMIEPGRFDRDWTNERGCPVPTYREEPCEERMQPVDLSPALRRRGDVRLDKLEVAASLGAVRAIAESSPGLRWPEPLRTAVEKLDRALTELNEKGHADA